MGTDYTLLIADGYCIPYDQFLEIIKKLGEINEKKTKKPNKKQNVNKEKDNKNDKETVNEWRDLDWNHYNLDIADQDNYEQKEQFNKMIFLWLKDTEEVLFDGKIGASGLLPSYE